MSPETALRAALRLGSSSLVLGEVRGLEVKVLYEAMQAGNAGKTLELSKEGLKQRTFVL